MELTTDPPIWRIGATISRPPALPSTMPCCQFCLGWRFAPLPNWTFAPWQRFFLHLPVNLNMAGTTRNPTGSLLAMCKQVANKPGACVLHVGTNGTIDTIINRLNSLTLPRSTIPCGCALLLEPPAGDGSKLGANWDELQQIFAGLDKKNNIGLCLDTQHLFGAGMCSFENAATVDALFERAMSLAPIGCIHLNDSKVEFNSHVDRHESIGYGKIWKDRKESLVRLLQLAYQYDIDIVTETDTFAQDLEVCSQALAQREEN